MQNIHYDKEIVEQHNDDIVIEFSSDEEILNLQKYSKHDNIQTF